jgi:hypothetical protein
MCQVRKLARVPADQQARFEAFMEDEQVSSRGSELKPSLGVI